MADGGPARDQALLAGFSLEEDINTLFVVWAATLVVLMQVGFALLEVAHVSPKNSRTVILKNTLDNTFGAAAWFLTGYALSGGAAGTGAGRVVGTAWRASLNSWAAEDPPQGTPPGAAHPDTTWVFYFSFASSAATIVSGATAERTRLVAHLIFSAIMCGFIYPVAHYWVWGEGGWLNSTAGGGVLTANVIDVAGSGVVHVVGGVAALVGAYIAGPRIKTPVTPDPDDTVLVPLHSDRSAVGGNTSAGDNHLPSLASEVSLKAVGPPGALGASGELPEAVAAAAGRPASRMFLALSAFIMWYSFYGFNLGALGGITGRASAAGRIVMVTTIGGMCGAVTAAMLGAYVHRWELSISNVCNGLLSGLVATAACCAVVPPWTAFVVGAAAATAFMAVSHSIPKLGIDDPVNAGPMHLCGGAVGLLAVGLLSRRAALEDFLQRAAPDVGVLFGGSGSLLGAQVLALCALTAWSAAASAAVFFTLRRLGLLRQPLEVEVLGIDARVFESKQHKSGMALSVLQQARASEQRCHVPHISRRRSNADVSRRSLASSHRSNSGSLRGTAAMPPRAPSPSRTGRPPPPTSLPMVRPELSYVPSVPSAASDGDPFAAVAANDAASSLPGSGNAAGPVAPVDVAVVPPNPDPRAPRGSSMRRSRSVSTLSGAASAPRESVSALELRHGGPGTLSARLAPVDAAAAVPGALAIRPPPAIGGRSFASMTGMSTGIVRAGSASVLSNSLGPMSPGGLLGPLSARSPEANRRPPGVLSGVFDQAAEPVNADSRRSVSSEGAVTVLSLDRSDGGCGGIWFSHSRDGAAPLTSRMEGAPMLVSRVYVPGMDGPPPQRPPPPAVRGGQGRSRGRDSSRGGSPSGGLERPDGSAEVDGIDTNVSELSFRRFATSSPGSSCGLSLGDATSNHGTRRRAFVFTPAPTHPGATPSVFPPAVVPRPDLRHPTGLSDSTCAAPFDNGHDVPDEPVDGTPGPEGGLPTSDSDPAISSGTLSTHPSCCLAQPPGNGLRPAEQEQHCGASTPAPETAVDDGSHAPPAETAGTSGSPEGTSGSHESASAKILTSKRAAPAVQPLHPMSEPLPPESAAGEGPRVAHPGSAGLSGPLPAFGSLSSVDVYPHVVTLESDSPDSARAELENVTAAAEVAPGGARTAASLLRGTRVLRADATAGADADGGAPTGRAIDGAAV